jgi:hypothetical protein
MNVDKLNSWLGVLASIGVLVGIVFLAMEVRHASNATQTQMLDSVADGYNALNLAVISDPQVARVWIVGLHEPNDLSDVEAVQFAMLLRSQVNQVQRLMTLNQLELYPDSEWSLVIEQLAGMLSTLGGRLFVESNKRAFPQNLMDEMQPYLDQEPKFDFILGRDSLPLQ